MSHSQSKNLQLMRERLLLALDLMELAYTLKEQQVKRLRPDAEDAVILAEVQKWAESSS